MTIKEATFCCKEVKIESVRYDLVRVIADDVDIDDVMKSIKTNGDIDEALDCLAEQDVIDWLERKGYTVTDEDEAA